MRKCDAMLRVIDEALVHLPYRVGDSDGRIELDQIELLEAVLCLAEISGNKLRLVLWNNVTTIAIGVDPRRLDPHVRCAWGSFKIKLNTIADKYGQCKPKLK